MKKVLLVVGSLNVGGLQKVAMEIVRICDPKEFSFDFLVYGEENFDYEQEVIELGCKVIRIPKPSKNYLRYYHNLKSVILNNGPYDIVHSHVYFNSAIVMKAAKKCDVACCISHSHSIARPNDTMLKKKIVYRVMRTYFKLYTDKYCACSKAAGENVFGREEFSKKGLVIVNPVNISQFQFNFKARNIIRKELNVKDSQLVIGNVGRIVPGKNIQFLIEIMCCYNKGNVVLLLVGDGEDRKNIENLAKQKGVFTNIRFVGTRNNVSDYLSAMDIFVMPSKHEGLGIVLIEAMANGLPCVYEKNAIVDEISQISYGYPMEGFNVREWKNKIDEVILNKRMDYEVVEKKLFHFSEVEFCKQIKNLYKQDGDS